MEERETERERKERPADFLRALRVNLQAGVLLASKTSSPRLSLSLSLFASSAIVFEQKSKKEEERERERGIQTGCDRNGP